MTKLHKVNKMIEIPKLVDLHTHLRFPYKEPNKQGLKKETPKENFNKETPIEIANQNIYKETLAAVNGGYGTVFSMPNTNPICDNINTIDLIRKQKTNCNIEIICAITKNEESKELVNFESLHKYGINFYSDDGKCVSNVKLLEDALSISKKLNIVIAEHAQDEAMTKDAAINKGKVSLKLGMKGWDRRAEYEIIKRDINLARKTKGNIHICHISTKESVELIKDAKKRKINITAEVTPHHLLFVDTDVYCNNLSTNYKMNPPLRTKSDVKALVDGIKNGVIDCIATDHAPHLAETKSVIFEDASFGVIGLETAFPTMYNFLVVNKVISLEKLIKLMRTNPAKIGQCVEPDGYFNFFENERWNYKQSVSNGQNSPLINHEILGSIKNII